MLRRKSQLADGRAAGLSLLSSFRRMSGGDEGNQPMTRDHFDPQEVAGFERATWSRCAGTYVEGFGAMMLEAIGPLLDEAGVSEGGQVLDLGTGPGLVAAAAAERGAAVIGIDFSKAMLEEARQRYPGVEFAEAAAESLPYADGQFSAVIGNFVLHHLGQPDLALSEACRVLQDGGRAAFTVWGEPSKLEAFGLFFSAVEEHAGSADLPHGPLFGISDFDVFHQMLRNAGFGESSVRELDMAWRTSSIEPYLASFADWANLEAFPESTRVAIESTVRERAEQYRSGNVLVLPNPAILVSAVK
jgi:ubiquinone/menaquinone biosynthesis C-methylase UbiE